MHRHLTYANVMATVAVFIALGGSAAALTQINGNQILDRSIAGKKLIKHTVTGTEVNSLTLGPVPSAKHAATAGTAVNSARLGGVVARPAFQPLALDNCSAGSSIYNPPGYLVDAFGFVHLEGTITSCSLSQAFTLPVGARPAHYVDIQLHVVGSDTSDTYLSIFPDGTAHLFTAGGSFPAVSLEGVVFRAGG